MKRKIRGVRAPVWPQVKAQLAAVAGSMMYGPAPWVERQLVVRVDNYFFEHVSQQTGQGLVLIDGALNPGPEE